MAEPAEENGDTATLVSICSVLETVAALASGEPKPQADSERLDWIIEEIAKGVWSPQFIAWFTETAHDRTSIDTARAASLKEGM